MLNRRAFLLSTAALASVSAPGAIAREARTLRLGAPSAFSFERLKTEARTLAGRPYVPPRSPPADLLDSIDYDALGQVHFNTDFALFRDGPGAFPVSFFTLGKFFRTPVRMFVLGGAPAHAREILYDADYFDMPAKSPVRALPAGAGFAGFRFQESRLGDQRALDWRKNDWVAFLGASYFRAIGELHQYGLSARGLALDVAAPDRPEEFPAFTRFYFEPPTAADTVVVYALLEGPGVAGAYRFEMTRGKAVLIEVEANIFLRRNIARLGLAPLTSMYWFSETEKPTAADWRPEVHDSDGLALWTGSGERIWRPLNNPPRTIASAFADVHPRGFGLMQRDRAFDHYLDGVNYDRRPSLWVEPLDDWGEGAVQLIEIPTEDEFHDNIVAFWVPKAPASAGESHRLRYRLHWTADDPFPPQIAACVATRFGRDDQAQTRNVQRFVVEFLGGPLSTLPFGVKPEAVLSVSRGRISGVLTEPVPNGVAGHWRARWDFTPEGADPVEMRLYLRLGDRALSETWAYQFHPPTA